MEENEKLIKEKEKIEKKLEEIGDELEWKRKYLEEIKSDLNVIDMFEE
jgi:hypothetical protein